MWYPSGKSLLTWLIGIAEFSGDRMGSLVWSANYSEPFDFRTQTYKGEPVLTFWAGDHGSYGRGSFYVLNQSYSEIAHFQAARFGDNMGDLHELVITDNDTALVAIYHPIPWDLSSVGGIEDGWLMDSTFQELNIETGDLIFEWNSSAHVGINETYAELQTDDEFGRSEELAWDWFHINSVEKDRNGDYIISGRTMSCIYKISGKDGHVMWRLNGKQSDFEFDSPDAQFHFQHDARWLNDRATRLTLWDNGDPEANEPKSRGMLLSIDQDAKTAKLIQDFTNKNQTFGEFMGSAQAIDPSNETTNFMLGYGSEPYFAELDHEGNVLLDVQLALSDVTSYRVYRQKWEGKPTTDPDMSLNGTHVYFSWNGATEVETWEVFTAENDTTDLDSWTKVASAKRTGFETMVNLSDVEDMDGYVRGKALNANGDELGWTGIDGEGGSNQRTTDDGDEDSNDSSDENNENSASSLVSGNMACLYLTAIIAGLSLV